MKLKRSEVNTEVAKEQIHEALAVLEQKFNHRLTSSVYSDSQKQQINQAKIAYVQAIDNFFYNTGDVYKDFALCNNGEEFINSSYAKFVKELVKAIRKMPNIHPFNEIGNVLHNSLTQFTSIYQTIDYDTMDEADKFEILDEMFIYLTAMTQKFPWIT